MADDLLTTLLLARADRPVLAAPAMNDAMYANPATTANIATLTTRGWHFVGPEIGALAEGPSERPGRMSEPEAIFAAAERLLGHSNSSKWSGKRVVVTAGPTREHLDPVRVITNPSSGRMGYALAEAARERGADVVLVTGPTELAPPAGLTMTRVETTEEMQHALESLVLNDATEPGAGFEVTTNRVTILGRNGTQVDLPLLPKRDVAERILDVVEQAL